MKKYLILIVVFLLYFRADSNAIPSFTFTTQSETSPVNPLQYFSTLSVKEVQKLAGRKLSLKEKISVKIFQWKIKKGFIHTKKENKTDKGKAAMILGIIGIASILIPYLNILSIPCTVLALVFGYQAKKANPNDSKARTAIILGWVTVGLYVLAILLVLAFIAAWGWR